MPKMHLPKQYWVPIAALLISVGVLISSCSSEPDAETTTNTIEPEIATPITKREDDWRPESPSTSLNKTYHIGMAIRTPEDMQLRFDAWPDEHKILVEPGLVVVFTYDAGPVSWVAPVFINHIPSFSSMMLDSDGNEKGTTRINSDEARIAINSILENDPRMEEIVSRAREFWN
jgi:hypothetical protein